MTSISIPGYKIIRTLGVGGQATVYLAIQKGFDREIALKVMSPALAADPSFGERFIREAKIVAKLRHPGIVTVFDVGEHDGFYYLAMEFLPETDLRTRITKGMKAKDALWVIQKVAKALHYAHSKGYIHRDVKSENILFREDGEPVLTDFGIAKASNSSTQMTQQGKLIGTPQYMSPEQCRGRKLDSRSDIYSLGIILYEMLTQNVPFDGEDSVAVCLQHVTKPVPRLSARQKHYQWLLDRMLAKKVTDRFDDAEKLSQEVEQFLAGDITLSHQTSPSVDEIRASRDDEHAAIFDDEDDMVADNRMVNRSSDKKAVWPWIVIPLLGAVGTFGYFKQELWLPKAQQLLGIDSRSQSIPNNDSNDPSGKGNSQQADTRTTSSSNAEEEARQKQIAQLLVEADTLEPLPDLDPAQVRQLLQNYVRVLVLDEGNTKAIAGKASTLQKAANYAESSLKDGNGDRFRQYYSIIESIEPEHSLLPMLDKKFSAFQQNQQEQEKVAENQEQIESLLAQANQALTTNRLTSPKGESALDYYSKVLSIDPNNESAIEGIASIKNRYVKLAQQSMLSKNIESASSSIQKLRELDANDDRLAELEQQYESVKSKVLEERKAAAAAAEKQRQEEKRKQLLADPLTQLKINSKLNAASVAYSEDRLVEPKNDSALAKYQEVLDIDYANKRAQEGIKLVESKLVDLTKKSIQEGNKVAANNWLSQLTSYFKNNSNIPVLKQQINELDVTLEPAKPEELPENNNLENADVPTSPPDDSGAIETSDNSQQEDDGTNQ
ncbi:serine/threonine protein kinase [Pleionea sediminis]|uniref:serine/threonine protein kinase n=1 Tax=Pleionea sediminis TaxID=2569479 RepID=UPI001184A5AA|nr:serine/threonine-protein kinase [Pleionea sediminis]